MTTLWLLLLPLLSFAQIANNRILFTAELNGQQEAPPVNTTAQGLATFLVSEDRSTVLIHGVFTGLSGPVTGCHLHLAPEGVAGPVFFDLSAQVVGNSLRADVPLPAGFFTNALNNRLYLNVHTAAHPSGEIRGQLSIKTDVIFGTALDGASEVPPVSTTASGIFEFFYSPGQNKGQYFAVVDGLSGPITAAHLHDGPAGATGPVYVPLTVTSSNTLVGEIDFTALPDFLNKLSAENLYINIHTAANPGGEVRGQVHSPGPFCFDALLNGDQETPPVASGAGGLAVATLTANLDTLVYKVTFHGLTPTAAHFHRGAAGASGPVILPLTQSNYPNFYAGRVPVSADVASDFIRGDVYVNIHTAAHPNGEIRGQMQPLLRTIYAFDLCGQQEVPPNTSLAEGVAIVSMSRLNTHLDYAYIVDGLSGMATAAHVHTGASGVAGPVLLPVSLPDPVGSGQFEADGNLFVQLESGNTYLNVHTAAFPGGEIRGQIVRSEVCEPASNTTEPLLDEIKLWPNPARDRAELSVHIRKAFAGQIVLRNTLGQMIWAQNQDFATGEMRLPVDLAGLSAGLFLLEIRSAGEGTLAVLKITVH